MKYLKNFNTLQEYEDAVIIDIPNVSYMIEDKIVKYTYYPTIPKKCIMYTSANGLVINPYKSDVFGALLISNEYNDFGLMVFNAPVTNIGDEAFLDCSSLTSITIPNSVTSIGNNALLYCSKLTSIKCEAINPPTLGSSNNLSKVTSVYVPAESVEAYKNAPNWSYYANKILPIQ